MYLFMPKFPIYQLGCVSGALQGLVVHWLATFSRVSAGMAQLRNEKEKNQGKYTNHSPSKKAGGKGGPGGNCRGKNIIISI